MCQDNVQQFTQVQYNALILTFLKAYGISLIGYDSAVQSVVSFGMEITLVNVTHVKISAECRDGTMFTRLRFSYILIGSDINYI